MNPSPDKIDKLKPNEVFVFGSNQAGRHGKGAALVASRKFGAQHGVGVGPTGSCYAIPTKSVRLDVLPIGLINQYVRLFKSWARLNPDKEFLVTEVGCGLAGYSPDDIAPLFKGCPANVRLPRRLIEAIEKQNAKPSQV